MVDFRKAIQQVILNEAAYKDGKEITDEVGDDLQALQDRKNDKRMNVVDPITEPDEDAKDQIAISNRVLHAEKPEDYDDEDEEEDLDESLYENVIDRLEQQTKKKISPGRNVLFGIPVDIEDQNPAGGLEMDCVDTIGRRDLFQALKNKKFKVRKSGKTGLVVETHIPVGDTVTKGKEKLKVTKQIGKDKYEVKSDKELEEEKIPVFNWEEALKPKEFKSKDGMKKNHVEVNPVVKEDEEDQLDELSKKTLGSYVKKSAEDAASRARAGGSTSKYQNTDYSSRQLDKARKRLKGVNKATDKLTKEELDEEFGSGPRIRNHRDMLNKQSIGELRRQMPGSDGMKKSEIIQKILVKKHGGDLVKSAFWKP